MTFYVQKSLAHGPIRFGVSPRSTLEQIDPDTGLSTGPGGDFLRRTLKGFFFADQKPIATLQAPTIKSISSTPFLSSLKPVDPRGWGFVAMMILGAILMLLGFAVLKTKGAQGWIEVILGIALIATPIVITAQKRRQLRETEEKERAEREERERRQREMLAAYGAALEQLRKDPNDSTFQSAAKERASLDLPYEVWSALARRTVLQIGFAALAKLSAARAADVSSLMDRAADAAGLEPADKLAVKLDLYRVLLWHLLADDRMGDSQTSQLAVFRKGFNISDGDVPVETQAAEEFRKLRGVAAANLPRQRCPIQLGFREYCIHATRGTMLDQKGKPAGAVSVYVTNKRVVVDARKKIEIAMPQIDDVEVDIDANLLTIRRGKPEKPVLLQVENPVYSAALIDIGTAIDERPKGFA